MTRRAPQMPARDHADRRSGTLSVAPGLPERIRRVVELYKTQGEAAGLVGYSDDAVRNWLSGRSVPQFDVIASLALKRGVSLEWLATGLGDMSSGSDSLLNQYSELPAHLRARVDQAVSLLLRSHRQHQREIDAACR